MKALGWQDLLWAAGVGGAAVGAFFLFRTPEPARTGLTLLDAVCGKADERRSMIERHVAEPLELSLVDVSAEVDERQYSRQELGQELARLDTLWPACAFSLHDWRIRAHGKDAHWLEGELEYSDSQPSDLHGRRRPLRALFREVEGGYRLERVSLGSLERRLPEARP